MRKVRPILIGASVQAMVDNDSFEQLLLEMARVEWKRLPATSSIDAWYGRDPAFHAMTRHYPTNESTARGRQLPIYP
jgi:hypothetical protein